MEHHSFHMHKLKFFTSYIDEKINSFQPSGNVSIFKRFNIVKSTSFALHLKKHFTIFRISIIPNSLSTASHNN